MEVIECDFEVWQALTARRKSREHSLNDVLREMLVLPTTSTTVEGDEPGWTWKGVNLPNGTELRAEYKGREYTAKILRNEWIQDGKVMSSPSHAASHITDGGVNGWIFWQARTPNRKDWLMLDVIRDLSGEKDHEMHQDERWKGVMKQLNRLGESLISHCEHAHINKALEVAVKAGEGKRKNLNHAFWSIRDWHTFSETLKAQLPGRDDAATKAVVAILGEMRTEQLVREMPERLLTRRWDTLLAD